MTTQTIAILMPGDMGHAVGRVLLQHGHDVITCLLGRGEHTCSLSRQAGLREVDSLDDVVLQADMILSILPPAAAEEQANAVATAMRNTGKTPVYVDCNAISPQTAQRVARIVTDAGASFIDTGIIGLAPGRAGNSEGPRFYVSGDVLEPMLALDGHGIRVVKAGDHYGEASGLKMVYAGLTKGTWTLHTAILLAAKRLGVLDTLLEEFAFSQASALSAMRAQVPFIPADSNRWIGEMEEIASTLSDTGVTSGFHDGAAAIFRLLAETPLAQETRADMDRSRTLEQALEIYADHLPPPTD